jgi:glycosyltransferase involved in cell wall biosynthesis
MLNFRRFIVENCIDIVHINQVQLLRLCFLGIYCTGARIVFTDHDSGFPEPRKFPKSLVAWALHGLLKRRVSRYVAVSNFVQGRLAQTYYVNPPQAVTLYNGVNIDRFRPRSAATARKELGLPANAPILCSVAMLIPDKGIQHLVKASASLVHKYGVKDLRVLVAGEGHYHSELTQLVEKLGIAEHIQFLGRRNDVQTLVAASNIVVVPSVWQESFGLIIAEAMAAARPVVASRTGGIPELIDHDITGLLVNAGNSDELASAIYQLVSDPEKTGRMGVAARKLVEERFDLARQTVSLVDMYEAVLA